MQPFLSKYGFYIFPITTVLVVISSRCLALLESVMKRLFVCSVVTLMFLITTVGLSFAQSAPTNTAATAGGVSGAWESEACDKNYMNTLLSQAWISAQFQNVINESLIHKPDSIFEYSCFHNFLEYYVDIADNFSETNDFKVLVFNIATVGVVNIIVTGYSRNSSEGMQFSIEDAIIPILENYLDGNFPHKFLGDTSSLDGQSPSIGSGACDLMTKVWKEAKCENFHPDWLGTSSDGIMYNLEDFVSSDPRKRPKACGGTEIKQWHIDLANNKNRAYSDQAVSENSRVAACNTDPVPTGLGYRWEIIECEDIGSDPNRCEMGEQTLEVKYYNSEEHVCPDQGCHYDEGSLTYECKE